MTDTQAELIHLRTRCAELAQRVTALEGALRPFAHTGDWIRSTDYDRAYLVLNNLPVPPGLRHE
jgi:hypothetical protein